MKDLHENKLFYRSLQLCYAVLAIATLEIFPPLNDLLQLTISSIELSSGISHEGTFLSQFPLLATGIKMLSFPICLALLMILDTGLSIAFERFVIKAFESR
jgi:hypothetical protein